MADCGRNRNIRTGNDQSLNQGLGIVVYLRSGVDRAAGVSNLVTLKVLDRGFLIRSIHLLMAILFVSG